jgi:N-methylhydantoinase B
MTNSWNTPVEAFEHAYPLRVEAYTTRTGSGGPGQHPGGEGIRRELRFLEPAEVTILSDRRTRGPWGLAGGGAGAAGRNTLISSETGSERIIDAKIRFEMRQGDTLRIESPGGGGWGPPG